MAGNTVQQQTIATMTIFKLQFSGQAYRSDNKCIPALIQVLH